MHFHLSDEHAGYVVYTNRAHSVTAHTYNRYNETTSSDAHCENFINSTNKFTPKAFIWLSDDIRFWRLKRSLTFVQINK